MAQTNCQSERCSREGKMRTLVDTEKHCKWTYCLCDKCDQLLQTHEKIALARGKGSRNAN